MSRATLPGACTNASLLTSRYARPGSTRAPMLFAAANPTFVSTRTSTLDESSCRDTGPVVLSRAVLDDDDSAGRHAVVEQCAHAPDRVIRQIPVDDDDRQVVDRGAPLDPGGSDLPAESELCTRPRLLACVDAVSRRAGLDDLLRGLRARRRGDPRGVSRIAAPDDGRRARPAAPDPPTGRAVLPPAHSGSDPVPRVAPPGHAARVGGQTADRRSCRSRLEQPRLREGGAHRRRHPPSLLLPYTDAVRVGLRLGESAIPGRDPAGRTGADGRIPALGPRARRTGSTCSSPTPRPSPSESHASTAARHR